MHVRLPALYHAAGAEDAQQFEQPQQPEDTQHRETRHRVCVAGVGAGWRVDEVPQSANTKGQSGVQL